MPVPHLEPKRYRDAMTTRIIAPQRSNRKRFSSRRGLARPGKAGRGVARRGSAVQGKGTTVGYGAAWYGRARLRVDRRASAWYGMSRHRPARQGIHGGARRGREWLAAARCGTARSGWPRRGKARCDSARVKGGRWELTAGTIPQRAARQYSDRAACASCAGAQPPPMPTIGPKITRTAQTAQRAI